MEKVVKMDRDMTKVRGVTVYDPRTQRLKRPHRTRHCTGQYIVNRLTSLSAIIRIQKTLLSSLYASIEQNYIATLFGVISLQGGDVTTLSGLLPEQLLVDILAERFQVS